MKNLGKYVIKSPDMDDWERFSYENERNQVTMTSGKVCILLLVVLYVWLIK